MYVRSYQRRDGKAGRWAKLVGLWTIIAAAFGGFGVAAYVAATHPPDAFALCQRSAIGARAFST